MAYSVKLWTTRAGDSLPAIAAEVYGDPRRWRPIADVNGIENPLLFPDKTKDLGRVLFIPRERV